MICDFKSSINAFLLLLSSLDVISKKKVFQFFSLSFFLFFLSFFCTFVFFSITFIRAGNSKKIFLKNRKKNQKLKINKNQNKLLHISFGNSLSTIFVHRFANHFSRKAQFLNRGHQSTHKMATKFVVAMVTTMMGYCSNRMCYVRRMLRRMTVPTRWWL